MTNHFPPSSVFCDKRSSCAWKPPTNRFMAFFHFRFFPFKSVFPRPFFTLHPSSFVQASDKFTAESLRVCVCVCNGCFDVRLADTAAYLKHVISTYLQYIIFYLCFFPSGSGHSQQTHFSGDSLFTSDMFINCKRIQLCDSPGKGGGDFGNRMLLICFEICGL